MDKRSKEKLNLEAHKYLKDLDLEYKFGCYKEHRGDSCHQHGEFLERLRNNFSDAYKVFKENCEQRKFPPSCLKYAKYTIIGQGCETNPGAAEEPLKIACDGEIPDACHYLSILYYNRDGKKRFKDVEKYMRRACDLQHGKSCWLLGAWYLGNVEEVKVVDGKEVLVKNADVVGRNPEKALNYGIMGCELGVPQACVNVSRMYGTGDGIEKNTEKAAEFRKRARELTGMPTKSGLFGS